MENIDFSAFSQDIFDPVEWLNTIFSSDDNDEHQLSTVNKKTMANNLVFKLQLMVEETNNSLQEIAQRMTLSIPKVIGEADCLYREASELCDQIVDVRTKLICSEQQYSEVMGSLIQMDRAKRRLQDLYQALQEANNWSVLSMDVEEVFESGDVEQISSKISSMQKSLELLSLSNSDGVQLTDKIETLENLKNRFEKLIEPMLLDAFTKSSESSIEFYSNLFKEFHRSDRLIQYYHTCLRDQLLKEWSTQVKVDSEGTVLDKLNFLYERFNMIWKMQMNFCMKVIYPEDFALSLQVLCDIFTDIIMSLNPPIDSFIHKFLSHANHEHTYRQKSLIELKQFTNSFVKNLEQNILSQYSENNNNKNISEFITRIKSLDVFIRTIYQPFAKMNESFILYEKERLDYEFDDMQNKYESMISSPCVIKLFSLVRDSYKLYSQYIESYPLLIVEDVIEDFLLKYLNLNINKKSGLQENLSGLNEIMKKSNSNSSMVLPNWPHIQKTLFKFETFGDFMNQFISFQEQVHANFLEYLNHQSLQQQQIDSQQTIIFFKRFDLFILNLDFNAELRERIENFIQTPSKLMNQVLNECIEIIKMNAQDICNSMFDYVQIQLNNFDASIEHELKQQQQKDSQIDLAVQELDDALTFSPNEYITQIGQYLLMLPQHLEPFNLNENVSFKKALHYSFDVFKCYSNLPETAETIAPTELLLECILRKTINSFSDHILRLSSILKSQTTQKLNVQIRKQIGVDLSYLAAVCEDLGLSHPTEFIIFIKIFNNDNLNSAEQWQKLKDENRGLHKLIANLEEMVIVP